MRYIVIISFLFLVGCGTSAFSGKTIASVALPDGKVISWENTKDISGLMADFKPDGSFRIEIEKSNSNENAIAAASKAQAEAQAAMAGLMQTLAPLLKAAGTAAVIP